MYYLYVLFLYAAIFLGEIRNFYYTVPYWDTILHTFSGAMIGCIGFSIWSLIGYKCKWRHIYCSYQNAYHEKMTPHSIRWHKIRKSDALGVPLIFLVFGIISLLLMIFD